MKLLLLDIKLQLLDLKSQLWTVKSLLLDIGPVSQTGLSLKG